MSYGIQGQTSTTFSARSTDRVCELLPQLLNIIICDTKYFWHIHECYYNLFFYWFPLASLCHSNETVYSLNACLRKPQAQSFGFCWCTPDLVYFPLYQIVPTGSESSSWDQIAFCTTWVERPEMTVLLTTSYQVTVLTGDHLKTNKTPKWVFIDRMQSLLICLRLDCG